MTVSASIPLLLTIVPPSFGRQMSQTSAALRVFVLLHPLEFSSPCSQPSFCSSLGPQFKYHLLREIFPNYPIYRNFLSSPHCHIISSSWYSSQLDVFLLIFAFASFNLNGSSMKEHYLFCSALFFPRF